MVKMKKKLPRSMQKKYMHTKYICNIVTISNIRIFKNKFENLIKFLRELKVAKKISIMKLKLRIFLKY